MHYKLLNVTIKCYMINKKIKAWIMCWLLTSKPRQTGWEPNIMRRPNSDWTSGYFGITSQYDSLELHVTF